MKQSEEIDGWWGFLNLCLNLDTPEQLDELFSCFLTIEERNMVAARYQVLRGLLEGELTQREMAKTYKLSIAQITRGSNQLKQLQGPFRDWLREQMIR